MFKLNNPCVLSSQLFLFAALFNYNNNYVYPPYIIFSLYLSSILYHSTGNLVLRTIDILITRLTIIFCIIISINERNIYPSIFTGLVIMFYRPNKSNLYHAIFVHIPGFFGFISLSF